MGGKAYYYENMKVDITKPASITDSDTDMNKLL